MEFINPITLLVVACICFFIALETNSNTKNVI